VVLLGVDVVEDGAAGSERFIECLLEGLVEVAERPRTHAANRVVLTRIVFRIGWVLERHCLASFNRHLERSGAKDARLAS
jgi:hypothetical protein